MKNRIESPYKDAFMDLVLQRIILVCFTVAFIFLGDTPIIEKKKSSIACVIVQIKCFMNFYHNL